MPRRRPAVATTSAAETPPVAPPQHSSEAPPRTGWSPRDILIPYVLLAVSLQRAHGYFLEEYLRSVGFFGLEMTTLYRTLRQLERDGLLDSNWEAGPAGPARRVYSLTDLGRAWLDHWASALSAYRRMLDQFFGLYSQGKDLEIKDERLPAR